MSYLTYLKIHHFKSIEDLELKDLSHINIIVGANNSGKTSLLEAMSIEVLNTLQVLNYS